ncbi:aminoacyltransferase [Staphylococcus succinus]|uniref:Aminoacyltransferase FemA n=2 Tax=Staphylococcus succinus TaxID=61015 RepID=A0A9Q6HPD5_9STAP|nr:aminoacyltransferase [Staphylococcus succinus]MEB7462553.1 aminoacyltransferase [Staphylococcus succinus]MEB8127176.1 aminoacyltransferase [Staphylococcus succinus]MEB8210019.1 aminoacyltransferase [Staphylococcus succinus]PKI21686.1 aminoacyltransferase [Staphylococcus succinus]PTI75858.1 aminoacyltransferase [Staphylococcus succinus]
MQFVNITPEEFAEFTQNNFSHYTQTRVNYEAQDQSDAHLLGVKNRNGEIIAAGMFTEARALKFFKYFYSQRGPVLDYNNIALVNFYFKSLTSYLKKHNCLYVLLDPYILENLRNADGEIIKSYDNRMLISTLDQLGYKHQGYPVGYSKTSQIRWLSVLDLKNKTEQQLLKEMDYQTRRNIKRTEEMGVKVTTLPIEETERFFKLFKMAEEKHGFSFRDESYFEELQKAYKGYASLQLAYIDLNEYIASLKEKHNTLNNQLLEVEKALTESPNSKKQKTKHTQLTQQINSAQRKIDDTAATIATDGPILDLAAAIYIYNDYEVYYLSSGSNPNYNAYMGAYKLQWEMIKFAKKHNIDRYNFYGITGDFSEDAEDYGVQQFKKGFNADVEEYIGDFVKPIKPLVYNIGKLIGKL